MLKVTQLEKGYLVNFGGDKQDFNQYMYMLSKITQKNYSLKDKGWIVPNTLELASVFDYQEKQISPVIEMDEYADMGKNMKLQPYPYQKEAIKFCIDNLKALLVLPCGSGKIKYFVDWIYGESTIYLPRKYNKIIAVLG